MQPRTTISARAKRLILASLALILVPGCASKEPGDPGRFNPDAFIAYPTPPDSPRVQFLMTFSNERDVAGTAGRSLLESVVGDAGEAERFKEMNKPYGIAIHDGVFYVCDTMLPGVHVVDFRERTFEHFQPRGQAELRKPINCSIDPSDGRLYVADTERLQVVVFDSAGAYVSAFGEAEGFRPTDVVVDGPEVVVSDIDGRQIRVYDKATYRLLRSFPDPQAEPPGSLFSPTNVYARDGRIYVSDFGDFRVKVYTREGEFVRSVGGYGRQLGQFVRPKGIAVDRDGVLYVVDAGFENVQMFDDEGKLLMFFGGPYGGLGDMWLPAKVTIDYDNVGLFRKFVRPGYELEYLIFVTNQYGPDRVNLYGRIAPSAVVTEDDEAT